MKYHDREGSIDSAESEFPNAKESLHIKLIYDRNKFISCPEEISKQAKQFFQHDLDKLLLSEKFTKQIFEKACKADLAHEPALPHLIDKNVNKVRSKLKLYNYIPVYNPETVNRQC